LGVIHIEPHY